MSADVIARCTRDGVIQWGQVAKQLGVSIDRARRMYDPVSSSRQDPQQLTDWPMSDAEIHKSPRPKADDHKQLIITLLDRHGLLSVEDLAARIHTSTNGIRSRLTELSRQGLCQSNNAGDRCGRTWMLTATGYAMAKIYTASRPGSDPIGPRAPSTIGKAA